MTAPRKTVAIVFGTRPEAIKIVPVLQELRKYPECFKPVVICTGQHKEMLQQVLRTFRIKPDIDLAVMRDAQTLGDLSHRLMARLEDHFRTIKPQLVLVQGDTTTTFLAALTAFYNNIPVGHIEAGLRTGDLKNPYPEELNRMFTTQISTWHFAPTRETFQAAKLHARAGASVYCTGNTVIDALKMVLSKNSAGITVRPQVLITAHRRESFGGPLENICRAVLTLAREFPKLTFIFPVHLNPRVQSTVQRLLHNVPNIRLLAPLPYETFVQELSRSMLVLTDSGGVQEEAPALGVPVLVLREVTERPEAVARGAVKLIGTTTASIVTSARKVLKDRTVYRAMARAISPYGDGAAAERIVAILRAEHGFSKTYPKPFRPGHGKIVARKEIALWPRS